MTTPDASTAQVATETPHPKPYRCGCGKRFRHERGMLHHQRDLPCTGEKGAIRRLGRETRALLVERFPLCFMPKGHDVPKKPLKFGIHRDIAAAVPQLAPHAIRAALHDYCNGRSYHEAVVSNVDRIDLDGNPAGKVTLEEVDYALAHLKRIQAERFPSDHGAGAA